MRHVTIRNKEVLNILLWHYFTTLGCKYFRAKSCVQWLSHFSCVLGTLNEIILAWGDCVQWLSHFACVVGMLNEIILARGGGGDCVQWLSHFACVLSTLNEIILAWGGDCVQWPSHFACVLVTLNEIILAWGGRATIRLSLLKVTSSVCLCSVKRNGIRVFILLSDLLRCKWCSVPKYVREIPRSFSEMWGS